MNSLSLRLVNIQDTTPYFLSDFPCIDLVKGKFHFRFKDATEGFAFRAEICDQSLYKNEKQRPGPCHRSPSHDKNLLLFQAT